MLGSRQCAIMYALVGLNYKPRIVSCPNPDVATITASAIFIFDWHKDTLLICTVNVRSGLFTSEVSSLLAWYMLEMGSHWWNWWYPIYMAYLNSFRDTSLPCMDGV